MSKYQDVKRADKTKAMLYIIKVPHQHHVTIEEFSSREDFIKKMRVESTNEITDFSDALDFFGDDLNNVVLVENQADLASALAYDTKSHKAWEIRSAAQKIQEEIA